MGRAVHGGTAALEQGQLLPGTQLQGVQVGHVQLQGPGQLRVLGGVVVLHSAAVAAALAPVHAPQGQVPLEIRIQHFLLLALKTEERVLRAGAAVPRHNSCTESPSGTQPSAVAGLPTQNCTFSVG